MPFLDMGNPLSNRHDCRPPHVVHTRVGSVQGPALTDHFPYKLIGLGAKWQCDYGPCGKIYALVRVRPDYDSYTWKLATDATAELENLPVMPPSVVRKRWWHK